ncbi:uroporphyrinogen-III C-methyltransferase [Elongatibacter sediminis]|uniref:Uroporphyrinogen-III C-methyltransferase n=1 Tax=Elongatibacter sediminis TaxID=3119006 RepID=A0AAW9RGT7_9GAMM
MNVENPLEPTRPDSPDATEPDTAKESAASGSSDGARRKSPGRGLAVLALLLALGAAAASGWLWWTDFQAAGEGARRQADEADRIGELEARLDQRLQRLQSDLAAASDSDGSAQLAALDGRLRRLEEDASEARAFRAERTAWARTLQASLEGTNARLSGLESRLDAVAARGLDAQAEADLAELDYLLRLAQERLELFRDVRTADRALALADAHVAAFDNPLFSGLRREIAAARREIAVIDLPDPAVLDRELDGVQDRLARLPFRGEAGVSGDSSAANEDGWWARLKSALSGLVTVRRTSDESELLPALADQTLIRQRAWLEIERVRLAAMRHDAAVFESALERARATIQRWFEPDDRHTRAVLQALESAAQLDVDPPLPDIGAPWAALRAMRGAGVAAPAVNQAQPPGAGPGEAGAGNGAVEDPADSGTSVDSGHAGDPGDAGDSAGRGAGRR